MTRLDLSGVLTLISLTQKGNFKIGIATIFKMLERKSIVMKCYHSLFSFLHILFKFTQFILELILIYIVIDIFYWSFETLDTSSEIFPTFCSTQKPLQKTFKGLRRRIFSILTKISSTRAAETSSRFAVPYRVRFGACALAALYTAK